MKNKNTQNYLQRRDKYFREIELNMLDLLFKTYGDNHELIISDIIKRLDGKYNVRKSPNCKEISLNPNLSILKRLCSKTPTKHQVRHQKNTN